MRERDTVDCVPASKEYTWEILGSALEAEYKLFVTDYF